LIPLKTPVSFHWTVPLRQQLTIFNKRFAQNVAKLLLSKNLAEHWDLPNTGIFYSKGAASGLCFGESKLHYPVSVLVRV
jgi:hypothetical protein